MLDLAQLNELSDAARYAAERDIAQILARYQAVGRVRVRHAEVLHEYDLLVRDMAELTGRALATAQGQLQILGQWVDALAAELAALEAA